VLANLAAVNPKAKVIKANSKIIVPEGEAIRGKVVLVVEDGPTVTHGEMTFGAGYVAAERYQAKQIIDPRPFAVGSITDTFRKYGHLDKVLPAMGYGEAQVRELSKTIEKSRCDLVVSGTPIDLSRLIKTHKPILPVRYELEEIGHPNLEDVLKAF
jgi:predicted GTPase